MTNQEYTYQPEEEVMYQYMSIPQPVRERMPAEWSQRDAVFWWYAGEIDHELACILWTTTVGALRVLEHLDFVRGHDNS